MGALLQIADHPSGKTFLPCYDGNGNVTALINADTGAVAAVYEYSPYGEPLRAEVNDPTMADNPFRFSTLFTDLETGLINYGHRYYSPSQGRFINRDPTEEAGGMNLYGFCGNDGINKWDVLGDGPYVQVINGVPYQIDMIPARVFDPKSVPAGSWTADPGKWGVSATLVWSLNGGFSLGLSPSQFVYVRTQVNNTGGPTITVNIPSPTKPTTPAPVSNPTPLPKSNLLPGYADGITANLVATLLVNEVAFPGKDSNFKTWDDTKRAMDAIAAELYNRIHSIPSGYTQYQIAHITTTSINDLILNSGQYQNFKGSIDQSVINHVNYLVGIANQGNPGAYSDAINYAINLSELLYNGGVPNDPFANQGGTLYHMATGNSPGGATQKVGTLGGNDFFTVPPKPPPRKPPVGFIGPVTPDYTFPDLPIAPGLIIAGNP